MPVRTGQENAKRADPFAGKDEDGKDALARSGLRGHLSSAPRLAKGGRLAIAANFVARTFGHRDRVAKLPKLYVTSAGRIGRQ